MKKVFVLLLLVLLSAYGVLHSQQKSRVDKCLTIFSDVLRQLDINYVDTLNYDDLIETAISGMLQKVDPYTVYLPKEKDETIKMMTLGKYGGIGAVIQNRDVVVSGGAKRRVTMVVNPYEGKPAQRSGMEAGDILVAIDGVKVSGMEVDEVSNRLRGVPMTPIKIEVERLGEKKHRVFEFQREDIKINPVDYTCIIDTVIDGRLYHTGYIRFIEFTSGSAEDFADSLRSLMGRAKLDNLVIDLRGNGGGILEEAVKIVNLFVEKNREVVSVKGKLPGVSSVFRTSVDPLYPSLPLMVMVDRNSASAAEILSGALQDFHRAVLIGERTFGKGLVQNLRPIAYDGYLKVTTAKYFLPSGRCIQAIDYSDRQKGKKLQKDSSGGILPDILTDDTLKFDITYELYTKNMFFDYATEYKKRHAVIEKPEEFSLSDGDIDDFCRFLDSVGFKYEYRTHRYYEDMLKVARMDDIDTSIVGALVRVQDSLLRPPLRVSIEKNIAEVRRLLGSEIVQRYYYQQGRTTYGLRFDKSVKRAVKAVNSPKAVKSDKKG